MRIAVVTGTNSEIYDEIQVAAEKEGHMLERIVPGAMAINSVGSSKLLNRLKNFDVVYYRGGLGTVMSKVLGNELKKTQTECFNFSAQSQPALRNKIVQIHELQDASVPVPKSMTAGSRKGFTYSQLQNNLGDKVIVKPVIGSGGSKVEKIFSEEDFLQMKYRLNRIYQEFVAHSVEVRCIMFNKMPRLVYQCEVAPDSFKANQSFGGMYQKLEDNNLKKRAKKQAKEIADYIDLDIWSIDFMHSKKDGTLYFNEINLDPGWSNLKKQAEINLPRHIIQHMEHVVK